VFSGIAIIITHSFTRSFTTQHICVLFRPSVDSSGFSPYALLILAPETQLQNWNETFCKSYLLCTVWKLQNMPRIGYQGKLDPCFARARLHMWSPMRNSLRPVFPSHLVMHWLKMWWMWWSEPQIRWTLEEVFWKVHLCWNRAWIHNFKRQPFCCGVHYWVHSFNPIMHRNAMCSTAREHL